MSRPRAQILAHGRGEASVEAVYRSLAEHREWLVVEDEERAHRSSWTLPFSRS